MLANKMSVPHVIVFADRGVAVLRRGLGRRRHGPAPPNRSFLHGRLLQGAQPLPARRTGLEAIRVMPRTATGASRSRVEFIMTLSEKMRAVGQAPLYIGDIGQPRGGPAPSGHAAPSGSMPTSGYEPQPRPASGTGAARRTPKLAFAGACRRWRYRRHGLFPAACRPAEDGRPECRTLVACSSNKWIKGGFATRPQAIEAGCASSCVVRP